MPKSKRDLTMEQQLGRGPVDLPFLMLVLLLVGIGTVMVFSASFATAYYVEDDPFYYVKRHAVFVAAGLVIMYLISKFNYQLWRGLSMPLLGAAFVLLVLVLTPLGYGSEEVGAQRWMKVFLVAGPGFQPSEIAKLAVILFFSARLAKRDGQKKRKWNRRTALGRLLQVLDDIGFLELVPYAAILLAMAGLMLKEPHLSGTVLIMAGGAAVLFAAGVRLYWFIIGGGFAAAGLWFIITFTDYMSARIELWLDPWSDAQNKGYQTIQSIYAIASGGLTGLGLGQSRQKYLYLPEPENDFIFSIAVEELGFIGAILIIALFALLIIRGYWLAIHARDRFGSLVIVGITTLLAVQVFLNIGVVTNFLPNTGISLPFFSYGGTALWIHMAEMGIILAVSRQIPAPKQE